jgi:hypothetical protein
VAPTYATGQDVVLDWTLTNAAPVAALGAETDFTVLANLALGGHRSLDYDPVTVWKA